MQREQIREQFSLLEEQLERLMVLSAPAVSTQKDHELDVGEEDLLLGRVKEVFDGLQELVHEETLRQKSIQATDFAQKLIKILIQEANAKEYKIAVSFSASGKISMEMVELSMSSILSCIKASLNSYEKMYDIERAKKNLFLTYSVYLEVHGYADEIHFRLLDDGAGYSKTEDNVEINNQFIKIRKSLAKVGGWFNRTSLDVYGGQIQFKLPLPRNRPEVYRLKKGEFEVLVPCFCVVETSSEIQKIFADKDNLIGELEAINGLKKITDQSETSSNLAVRIGVADFEVWILCDSMSDRIKSRKYDAKEFLEDSAWYSHFGLCQINNVGLALPLLDGNALVRFYSGRDSNENS